MLWSVSSSSPSFGLSVRLLVCLPDLFVSQSIIWSVKPITIVFQSIICSLSNKINNVYDNHLFSFLDDEYERIIVMRYEKELETKFEKSRYNFLKFTKYVIICDIMWFFFFKRKKYHFFDRVECPKLGHSVQSSGFNLSN